MAEKKQRRADVVLVDQIEPLIMTLRGEKVILDNDLALLYGVPTKALNQAVKRNAARFPGDFVFQLTPKEENLRSQSVTSSGHGGRRYAPYAFTEHGAIMAASVLNTPQAVHVSVYVVRAFVKLRQIVAGQKELARKIAELEKRIEGHDEAVRQIVAAIKQLMTPPSAAPRKRIGFHAAGEA